MLSQEVVIAILSVSIPAIVTIAGIVIAWQTEKLRTMRSQLSERKHKAYAEIIGTFYLLLKDTKKNQPTNMKMVESKMIDAKRDIFMYGSDEVFKAFNKWLVNASTPQQIDFYLEFILSIRKDICGKTKLKKDDILLNLIQNDEELQKFKSMIQS